MVFAVLPSGRHCIMQAAEDALTKKHSEPIVAAAVALAAIVSVESPFIHVATIQVINMARPDPLQLLLGCNIHGGMPMAGDTGHLRLNVCTSLL